jgi:hypothetical protein
MKNPAESREEADDRKISGEGYQIRTIRGQITENSRFTKTEISFREELSVNPLVGRAFNASQVRISFNRR